MIINSKKYPTIVESDQDPLHVLRYVKSDDLNYISISIAKDIVVA
jgi:hypothetical protein